MAEFTHQVCQDALRESNWYKKSANSNDPSAAVLISVLLRDVRSPKWIDNERSELTTMHELRVMGSAGWVLVVVSTVFGAAILSSGAASADGPVQMKSQLGDVCLDAPSWIGDIPVVINPCNGTDFQYWNLNGRQLENAAFPGKCLTMPVQGTGAVDIEYCRNAFVQHWSIQPNGQVTSDSGNCLTVLGGPGPGTRVAARWCNGGPGQGWVSVP